MKYKDIEQIETELSLVTDKPFWLYALLVQSFREYVTVFPRFVFVWRNPVRCRSSWLRFLAAGARGPSTFLSGSWSNSNPGVIILLFQWGKFSSRNLSNSSSEYNTWENLTNISIKLNYQCEHIRFLCSVSWPWLCLSKRRSELSTPMTFSIF